MLPNPEELVEKNIAEQLFEIEIGNRTLPGLAKRFSDDKDSNSEHAGPLDKSLLDLKVYLANTVNSQFASCNSILNAITLKESVETYAKILQIFNVCRAEWQTFCRSLIVIQGQVADESDEAKRWIEREIKAWHSQILGDVSLGGAIHTSRLTAELAARPLNELRSSLHQEFEQLKRQFVTEMLDMLIQLVGLEAIGLVQWFASDKCTYSSYVRKCEFSNFNQTILSRHFYKVHGGWKRRDKIKEAVEEKRTLVRRIQHLVEATEYKVGESKVTVPREQLDFLRTIPQWLSPAIRIVEGMLIRETMVEQDLGVQKLTETEDRVQWHNDPAITLGPFVLSAWGEAEIRREEQRQTSADNAPEEKPYNLKDHQWPWNKVTGFALLAVAAIIIQVYPASPFSIFVGFALGWIAAVVLGTQFSSSPSQSVASASDNETSRQVAIYAVCGATILLISTLLSAHGYYLISVPIILISTTFWVHYIKATRGWNIATARDE